MCFYFREQSHIGFQARNKHINCKFMKKKQDKNLQSLALKANKFYRLHYKRKIFQRVTFDGLGKNVSEQKINILGQKSCINIGKTMVKDYPWNALFSRHQIIQGRSNTDSSSKSHFCVSKDVP